MKRIGIIGSRRRDSNKDYELTLKKFMDIYDLGDIIISGGCPTGGDHFAERIATALGLPVVRLAGGEEVCNTPDTMYIHVADWDLLGRKAGLVRNTYIARDADVILAVVADDRTGGTEDTIRKAEKLGKEIILI